MKIIMMFFAFLPQMLAAQFLNFSGGIGRGKHWQTTNIEEPFALKKEFKPNKLASDYTLFELRTQVKIGGEIITAGINNAYYGLSFGFNFKQPLVTVVGGIRTTTSRTREYLQIPLLIQVVKPKNIIKKWGQKHGLAASVSVGLAFNTSQIMDVDDEISGVGVSNASGNEDIALYRIHMEYLKKSGYGLMSEIVLNRFKKKSGIPSTLFLKIVIHQGFTKLAQGSVNVTFNDTKSSTFNFISRGSYAGLTLGFYFARNKGFYQKQNEYLEKLKIGSQNNI